MSEPSSCAIEDDSPVCSTRASRCGRAMSHRPSAPTYAMPSVNTLGVSWNAPAELRTKPSSSSVSSSRRAVGRARPAAAATSDRVIAGRWASKQASTSSPRASASTKSGPAPRPAIDRRPPRPRLTAEHALLATGALRLVLEVGVLVRIVQDGRLGGRHLGEHPGLPDLLAALLLQVVDGVLDLGAHRREVDADQFPFELHHPAVDDDGVHVTALRLEG